MISSLMFIWLRFTLPQFASYLSSFQTDPNVIKIIFLSINYFMKRIKSNQKADFNNMIKLIEEKIIII